MAAKPKLSPEQWAEVRLRWERDQRPGYTWLVEELHLPVSAPAVRKVSLRDGWAKRVDVSMAPAAGKRARGAAASRPDAGTGDLGEDEFEIGRVSVKVSRNHRAEAAERKTRPGRETMPRRETMPLTTVETVERDPDQFGVFAELSDMQELFVREYLIDLNGKAAAIRAGYSARSAETQASRLLSTEKVRDAVAMQLSIRAKRLGIDADEVIRIWVTIVNLDYNEFSQLRRVCCPYCWGEGHARQYTPSGLQEAIQKHARERARRKKADAADDIGEFPEYTDAWYDKRKAPHEDCPECHGRGIEEVFFNDTRNLSPAARLAYCGVKVGKEGIEVLTLSKEKMLENLARALGLFKEKEAEVNINLVSGDELYRAYDERMRSARARQAAVLVERGLTAETVEPVSVRDSRAGAQDDDLTGD